MLAVVSLAAAVSATVGMTTARAVSPPEIPNSSIAVRPSPTPVDAAHALRTAAGSVASATAAAAPGGPGPAGTESATALGAALAQAKAAAKPVVDVPALRTKYTDTTVNPNGTYTKTVSPIAINAQQGPGHWLPIDMTLHKAGNTIAAARSGIGTLLGGGGGPQIAGFTVAGHHVSVSATSALPAPAIVGSTATYTDALIDGASLVVNNLSNGIEISAVLPTRLAVLPASWDFPIDLGGLTPVKAVGGQSFSLNDASGSTVGAISGAFVKDSTTPMPRLDGFTQDIVTTPAGTVLRITPDVAYLLDPATTYPVTVDPSVTEINSDQGDDTFIWSQAPQRNTNWGGDPWLYAGTWSDGSYSRVELGFPSGGWLNSGDVVQSAQLGLSNAESYACQTGNNAPRMAIQRIQNHPINQSDTWNTDAVWNPIVGTDVSASYDTYSEPKGCPANPGGPGDLEYFDVTNTVQGWANGAYPNYGLQLITQENTQLSFRQFRSGDQNGATGDGTTARNEGQPVLVVTYDNGASNVTSVVPENNSAIVSWTGSPSSPDSYLLAIFNQDNGALLGTVGVGNETSQGVQFYNANGGGTGELTNGQNITFFVYAHNSFGYRPPGSGMTAVIQNYPSAVYGPDGNPSTPPSITTGNATITASWTQGNLSGARSVSQYTAFLYTPGTSWPSAATAYCFTGTATTVTFGPGALPANCSGSAPVNGTTYDIEIFEQNQSGDSYTGGSDTGGTALPAGFGPPATSAVALVPAAPAAITDLDGSPGPNSVELSWSAPNNNGSAIIGYTVTVRNVDTDAVVTTAQTPGTTATVNGLDDGTDYYVTVSATNNIGTGPASNASEELIPVGPPSAPASVTAVPGDGGAIVSWTPGNDGAQAITGYTITVTSNGNVVQQVSATGSPTYVAGLTDTTQNYSFTVSATNTLGTSPQSSASATVTSYPGTPVTAPQHVVATGGDSTVSVSWLPALDLTTGYTVRLFDANSYQVASQDIAGSTSTSATLSNLGNGNTYYAVVSGDGQQPLAQLNTFATATPAVSTEAQPGAVADLEGGSDGQGTISLGWGAANSEGSAVTGYRATASPGGETQNLPADTYGTTFTDLVPGLQYTFSVLATNVNGDGTAATAGPYDPGINSSNVFTAQSVPSGLPGERPGGPPASLLNNGHTSTPAPDTRSLYLSDLSVNNVRSNTSADVTNLAKRTYTHACADDHYTPANTATIYQLGTINRDGTWQDTAGHPFNQAIAQAVGAALAQAAVQCYNSAAGGQHVIIIGINNAPFDVPNYDLANSASAMAAVVNAALNEQKSLGSNGSTVGIAPGVDAEQFGFHYQNGGHISTVQDALTWEGDLLADQAQAIYDYGDADGCSPNSGNSTVCKDAAQVQGMLDNRAVFAFPQIYNRNGAQAANEAHLVDIGTKGHHVEVVGALTTYNTCHPFFARDAPRLTCNPTLANGQPDTTAQLDNTPDEGLAQLVAAIKHEQPQGIAYLSDLSSSSDLSPAGNPPPPKMLP